MFKQFTIRLKRLTFAHRFMLTSFFILLAGMTGIGIWVEQQIELGVMHSTAATTALYVDSFIAEYFQELNTGQSLPANDVSSLDRLLQDTSLGQEIVAFKVWNTAGQVLYSSTRSEMGRVFPMKAELANALKGQVNTRISDLSDEENKEERALGKHLLETYSPVRLRGTNRIIAVAEFYQSTDPLQADINAARQRSWFIVGIAMFVMYFLLASFVRQANNTILRQQAELSQQVIRLQDLLSQNEELSERVRRAAARAAAVNERFLRRISAEIHDGPVQDLGLALFRLDNVAAGLESFEAVRSNGRSEERDLGGAINSVQHALREMRAIALGVGLPELDHLTIGETIARVVRGHERRTGTRVQVQTEQLPDAVPLPVKITLYRVIQEALNNAHRHGGGIGQRVRVVPASGQLQLEIVDEGAGFEGGPQSDWDEHLGLIGMRERVESLGGIFRIASERGQGTKVMAQLPLQTAEA